MNDPGTYPTRACAGVDSEVFFPKPSDKRAIRHAVDTYCAACPVADICLEFALEREGRVNDKNRDGIFGGATPKQRAAIAAARPLEPRPITHGTSGGYRMHQRRGEPPCWRCAKAESEKRSERKDRQVTTHGTVAGEKAHRRSGEQPCQDCLQAKAAAVREARRRTA